MKKLLVLVCAAIMSISASAQKGEKAIGVNLSYGSEIKNAGIGVKGQYFLADRLRGEASVDYFFKKDYTSMLIDYMQSFQALHIVVLTLLIWRLFP